jgi:hypothetical protein
MDVAALLTEPDREWSSRHPARKEEIEQLSQVAPGPLPNEYVALLRYSNGGEGPLALPPFYFMLYEVDLAREINENADQRELYPGYFVIGSNGGLEIVAFDTRGTLPWPIVAYDPVAGTRSAVTIAKHMEEFIRAIGKDDRN